jgi:D-lactate dehydrogenase (cytochrome)
MRAAAQAATQVIHQGVPVGAVELLDDVQMDVINRMGATGREWKKLPTLFFKFSGTQLGVQDNVESVRKIVHENGGSDFTVEQDKDKQHVLWSARKEALWSMMCLKGAESEVWSTDVAVPLSKVAELIGNFDSYPNFSSNDMLTFFYQRFLRKTLMTWDCLVAC